MESRSLNNKSEEERFRIHVINGSYEKILILWGTEPLVALLKWYQFIGYQEGITQILKCLKDYSEEYYS